MSIKIQLAEDMKTGDIGEISDKDGLLYLYKEKVYKWRCTGCENSCLSTETIPPVECIISPGHPTNNIADWKVI